MSLVLSIFFLGLSLGSWIAGKFAWRMSRPILVYGVLEGLIGLYSAGLIYFLFSFHKILDVFPITASFSNSGTALMFGLVFLLLLIPTTLMGASLPILIRIFVNSSDNLGKKISFLYGANTLGAVAGAFVTGFILIPNFGVLASNHGTAILNFIILIGAMFLQKFIPPQEVIPEKVTIAKVRNFWLLWTTFVMGFSSLTAEVVWNKYLGIFLGSNIYGLSLVLSLFLLGIAIGSLTLSQVIERIKDRSAAYVNFLALCALGLFVTSFLLGQAPTAAQYIYSNFSFLNLLIIKSFAVVLVILFPSTLMGALLPLGIRLMTKNFSEAPKAAGKMYATNTLGAILGSALSGLVLVPTFGSGVTLQIAYLTLALSTLGPFLKLKNRSRGWTALAALALLSIGAWKHPTFDFQNILRFGYYQQSGFEGGKKTEEFVQILEGRTGVISLSHNPQDGEDYKNFLRLKTNGLDESIFDLKDLKALPKYEALLGALPLSLARNPEKAFVVGYGGGYTVDFLTSTDVGKVKVIELENSIIEASNFVHKGQNPILKRTSLDLQIEDARFVLARGVDAPFDIIVSQPSHSWLMGATNLFTKEFFEIVLGRLSDEGVFSQWLNLYNMSPNVLMSILKTFYSVFPHGAVFTGAGDQELIMIGSKAPLRFDLYKLNAIAQDERVRRQLGQISMNDAYDLLSQFALSREEVWKLAQDSEINTDQNAFAEVTQSQLFYKPSFTDANRFLIEFYSGNFENVLRTKNLTEHFYDHLLESLENQSGQFSKTHKLLELYRRISTDDYRLAFHAQKAERYATALSNLQSIPNSAAFNLLIGVLISTKDLEAARVAWKKYRKYRDATSMCYELELFPSDDLALKLERDWTRHQYACGPFIKKSLGLYFEKTGKYEKALPILESYYLQNQSDPEAYAALTNSYSQTKDTENAERFGAQLNQTKVAEKNRLKTLSDFYRQQGLVSDAEALLRLAN